MGKTPNRPDVPSIENLRPEFKGMAEKIANLTGTWNPVEIYTADKDSIDGEQAKFFTAFQSGEIYNPTFTYSYARSLDLKSAKEDLEAMLHELRSVKVEKADRQQRVAKVALYYKIKDDLATCNLVEGIQNNDEVKIKTGMHTKYPQVDDFLLSIAQKEYRAQTQKKPPQSPEGALLNSEEQQFLKGKEFDAQGIKQAFEWSLDKIGILQKEPGGFGFRVVIDPNTTSIDVRDKSSQGSVVSIPEKRKVTGDKLLELINHELRGHARQSANGQKLLPLGGGKLKVDDETLYEGLAKRYDREFRKKFFGTEEGAPIPYYAIAAHRAENGGSFHDVFSQQLDLRLHVALKRAPEEELPAYKDIDKATLEKAMKSAWGTTYRVMRGHTDTSNGQSYAMTKDASYLLGDILDTQLREKGYGFINEAGVIADKGLQLLAEFNLTAENLPFIDRDIALEYWEEVLKPMMNTSK